MYEADRQAVKSGIAGHQLMENAGRAIADLIVENYDAGTVAVLCGPGNNGGDGFVAARLLKQQGWQVNLSLLGAAKQLSGDAAVMAQRWDGAIAAMSDKSTKDADIIVDAVFGAGLARDIDGCLADLIAKVNQGSVPVIAVDVPSGIDGLSGVVRKSAFKARQTISFCRKKPGHLLMPGREYCGNVSIVDIGISEDIIRQINPAQFENTPDLWRAHFPRPAQDRLCPGLRRKPVRPGWQHGRRCGSAAALSLLLHLHQRFWSMPVS